MLDVEEASLKALIGWIIYHVTLNKSFIQKLRNGNYYFSVPFIIG